jgi:hypothetical protein
MLHLYSPSGPKHPLTFFPIFLFLPNPTIFNSTTRVQLASQQNDSISDSNYSSYVNKWLSTYHQQETSSAISATK